MRTWAMTVSVAAWACGGGPRQGDVTGARDSGVESPGPVAGGGGAPEVDASAGGSGDAGTRPMELDAGPADAGAVAPAATDGGPTADPSRRGPFEVGVRTVRLTDPTRGRAFDVDVWYPTGGGGKANVYELKGALGSLASIASPARRDAPPLQSGPRPLVVFSHGFGGVRFQSYFLTEQLASHGLVVAAPDHPGNTLLDFASLGSAAARAQSAVDRPLDVAFVTDRLLAGLPALAGLAVDPGRLGLSGHSFGGWTALEAARRDARFRTVIPLAPGFRDGSTPAFVATLQRPLLLIGGSEDGTCEFGPNQQVPYQLAAPPKALLKVIGAGHLDFSNLCEVPLAPLLVNDGCDPMKILPADVQQRVRTVATAFALKHLAGAAGQEAFLDDAAVKALGKVDYWSAP